jgi:hypothetical protein
MVIADFVPGSAIVKHIAVAIRGLCALQRVSSDGNKHIVAGSQKPRGLLDFFYAPRPGEVEIARAIHQCPVSPSVVSGAPCYSSTIIIARPDELLSSR